MKEREIIDLLKAHDERGMEELLKLYGPLMKYIIAPILHSREDREDCLSETAMRVWEKIGLYDIKWGNRADSSGCFKAWLTALTRNAAINYARKNKHEEYLDENMMSEIPSNEQSVEISMIKKEQKAELAKALNELSVKDRALFYRKYYYLQQTSQIALELSMTERAVEGRLYRIKKKLRKRLGGNEYE